jgi:hypothetical protein
MTCLCFTIVAAISGQVEGFLVLCEVLAAAFFSPPRKASRRPRHAVMGAFATARTLRTTAGVFRPNGATIANGAMGLTAGAFAVGPLSADRFRENTASGETIANGAMGLTAGALVAAFP